MGYLGKLRLVVLLVVSMVGTSGCDDSQPPLETVARPARTLTAQDKELLKEIQRYEFETLEQINLKGLDTGDPAIERILSRNNSLWIQLYEASKDPDAAFGIKSTGFTEEGDPVTTYYLAVGGRVRIITDSRHDPYAGGVNALSVKTPNPFYIGYAGVDLPCPCGSGKTWLDCNPGQCRTATLIIVTDKFPKDKQLHWIRPPDPDETSTTWQFAADVRAEAPDASEVARPPPKQATGEAASECVFGAARIVLDMTKADVLKQIELSRSQYQPVKSATSSELYVLQPNPATAEGNEWLLTCPARNSHLLGGGAGIMLRLHFKEGRLARIERLPWVGA